MQWNDGFLRGARDTDQCPLHRRRLPVVPKRTHARLVNYGNRGLSVGPVRRRAVSVESIGETVVLPYQDRS